MQAFSKTSETLPLATRGRCEDISKHERKNWRGRRMATSLTFGNLRRSIMNKRRTQQHKGEVYRLKAPPFMDKRQPDGLNDQLLQERFRETSFGCTKPLDTSIR
jgi:hypothetical protein